MGPAITALFHYGTLADNGLDIGSIAGGLSTELLFNIPGQVNLRLGAQVIQYWDGDGPHGSQHRRKRQWRGRHLERGNTNWTAATGFGVNDRGAARSAFSPARPAAPSPSDGNVASRNCALRPTATCCGRAASAAH